MSKLLIKSWPLIILTFVIFAFFAKLFFPPSIFITPDLGRSDAWHLSIANKYYLAKNLKQNLLPLWNNQIGSGFPTLAEGQTGIFFPTNLILFKLLPFALAYDLNIVLTITFAAIGSYLFARALGINKLPAIYAGLIFALGAFFTFHLQHLHLIQTASLTPWLFWSISQFRQTPKIIYLIYFSMAIALQILAGFPQLAFYSLVFLAIFVVLQMLLGNFGKKLLLPILTATVLGLALSAVQILPTLELLSVSIRESRPKLILEQFPYKYVNLLQFIDPYILGTPQDDSYPRWQPGEWGIFWENSAYVGILPLALALAVVISAFFKRDNNHNLIIVFAALSLISLLLTLGKYSPLHPVFSFPPFSIFRVPSRFLLFTQFSLSLLAAIYLQKFSKKNLLVILVITVSFLNLYLSLSSYNMLGRARDWLKTPQTAQFLKENGHLRIFSIGHLSLWNQNITNRGWRNNPYFFFARNSLDPNSNLIFNINQLASYESLLTKRETILTTTLLSGRLRVTNGQINITEPIANLLTANGVSHIISPYEIESDQFKKVFTSESQNDTEFKIFQNKNEPQRIYMVDDFQIGSSIPQIISFATSDDFSPADKMILELDPRITNLHLQNYQVKILKESTTHIQIKAKVQGNGFLVLADSFYPGWQAYVDGQKTSIYAANIDSRAIYVEEGDHDIEFKFESKSIKTGAYLSITALISLIILLIRFRNWRFT